MQNGNIALSVGLVVVVTNLCLIPITGGPINPARITGPAIGEHTSKFGSKKSSWKSFNARISIRPDNRNKHNPRKIKNIVQSFGSKNFSEKKEKLFGTKTRNSEF